MFFFSPRFHLEREQIVREREREQRPHNVEQDAADRHGRASQDRQAAQRVQGCRT